MKQRRSGFTIVELLLVIVVVGILATIVLVMYNGIQRNSKIALIKADLETAQKQIQLDQVNRGTYVEQLTELNNNTGLKITDKAELYYSVYNEADPADFCLTATLDDLLYKVTSTDPVSPGACGDQLPTAPALSTNGDSSSQITISWEAVANASSYRVEMNTTDSFTGDGTGACSAPNCRSGSGTSQVFTGLSQNADYYFRAFTTNALGTSDESDHVSETTLAQTPGGAPALTAGTAACTTVALSWTAISPVTSYTIQRSAASSFTSPTTTTGVTGTSRSMTGLTCGTKYYFRIAAVNGSQGPWSNSVTKTTTITTPGTPSVSVTIPGQTRAGSASNWAQTSDGDPGGSGSWFYAGATISGSSCPSGTTRQFKTRIHYASQSSWGPWTGFSASTSWYGVQPLPGYGIRFAVQARCYTAATTSSGSTVGYGCRWRSGSTSCSGF